MDSINPFQATGLFLYPLKTSENQRFSDVFRGHRKRPVAWNGLRSKWVKWKPFSYTLTLDKALNQSNRSIVLMLILVSDFFIIPHIMVSDTK